jgi:hypothetical protein
MPIWRSYGDWVVAAWAQAEQATRRGRSVFCARSAPLLVAADVAEPVRGANCQMIREELLSDKGPATQVRWAELDAHLRPAGFQPDHAGLSRSRLFLSYHTWYRRSRRLRWTRA